MGQVWADGAFLAGAFGAARTFPQCPDRNRRPAACRPKESRTGELKHGALRLLGGGDCALNAPQWNLSSSMEP
jgi:hypothetical protein